MLPEHQDVRLGRVAKVIAGEGLYVQLYSLLDVRGDDLDQFNSVHFSYGAAQFRPVTLLVSQS